MTINVPPAATVLAVCATVYGIVQTLKKVPGIGKYITGWFAVAVNVVFSVTGTLIANAITPANLYTLSTLQLIGTAVVTAFGAAGIHGSIKLLFPHPQIPDVSASGKNSTSSDPKQKTGGISMRSALLCLKTTGLALMASLLIMLPLPLLTGCTVSIAQIQTDAGAVATALQNVANIEQQTDPALAAELAQAAQALQTAAAGLQAGTSPLAILNDALNTAAVALSYIPATAMIAPLIPIAEAAIDILVSDIAQQSPASAKATPVPTTNQTRYHYTPAQIHHRMGRSPEGDFVSAWNAVVKQHSELASAALK